MKKVYHYDNKLQKVVEMTEKPDAGQVIMDESEMPMMGDKHNTQTYKGGSYV